MWCPVIIVHKRLFYTKDRLTHSQKIVYQPKDWKAAISQDLSLNTQWHHLTNNNQTKIFFLWQIHLYYHLLFALASRKKSRFSIPHRDESRTTFETSMTVKRWLQPWLTKRQELSTILNRHSLRSKRFWCVLLLWNPLRSKFEFSFVAPIDFLQTYKAEVDKI